MLRNKSMLVLRGALLLALFGSGATQVTGCAQDVGTVDRTRPDKVPKSMFEGDDEWFFRQTVVEGPTQGAPVGHETPLKRIRWTITEDTLFAYSTTEPAIGTEKGLQNDKDRRLGIVAAFPIVKHFDIQRGYSSSTGQLSNTIEENTSDRLWYQRDYLRVDWSRNQIDGVMMFSGYLGHASSIARTVPESDSAKDFDRTRITNDNIDVVTEYYFEPEPGACGRAFGFESWDYCEAGPMKVRNSFIRVPKKKTFEPTEYFDYRTVKDDDGKPIRTLYVMGEQFQCDPAIKSLAQRYDTFMADPTLCHKEMTFDFFSRFGYFRTERAEFSLRRGTSYLARKKYYANHWNIWQTAYDDDGNLLKLEDRKPKQIVYYLNVGFPEEKPYLDSVELLQESWNQVFTKTVRLTHNFDELTGQGVYSWMQNLLAEANKADLKGVDLPDEAGISNRIEYPKELAAKGLVYLQGVDAASPSSTMGWKAFCARIGNTFSPLNCDTMTEDDLKTAIDSQVALFVSSGGATNDYVLQKDSVFAAMFDLARIYMTSNDSGFAPTDSELKAYFEKVKSSVADVALRSKLPEPKFDDAKWTKVRQLIAENNGGDDHMFRIKENSCSPNQLEVWKGKYGTVSEEVKALFAQYGNDAKSLRKLPVKDLREFCAQLEWATKDEQNKDARFDWQRVGDLRYSFVNWVNQRVGYLGLGPSATDPETGEIISATANFAGRAIAGIATAMTDVQMYNDGRLSLEDMQTGSYIADDLRAHGAQIGAALLRKPSSNDVSLSAVVKEPFKRPFGGTGLADALAGTSNKSLDIEKIKKSIASMSGSSFRSDIFANYKAATAVRDEKLKKINQFLSEPESLATLLANPEYSEMIDILAKAYFGEGPYTEDQRKSVLAQVNVPFLASRRQEALARKKAMQNLYPLDAMENAMDSLVTLKAATEYFKDKSRDEIEDYFKTGIFYGVQLHELGHTFGLRHNFSGSTDAFNYNPGYWQVAAKSYEQGKSEAPYYLSRDDFKNLTGHELPGAVKFYSEAEFRGTASIMDYTPDLNLDFTGLGSYDDAAIQFVYGKKIQIFDDSIRFDGTDKAFVDVQYINYKDYPALFAAGLENDLQKLLTFLTKSGTPKQKAELYPAAINKMLTARRWVSVDEAIERQRDELKRRSKLMNRKAVELLKTPPSDQAAIAKTFTDMRNFTDSDISTLGLTTPVPYRFCSDEFANGSLNCEVWDYGANQDEVADYRVQSYETSKVYTRYARGTYGADGQFLNRYLMRLFGTYQNLQQVFYIYSYLRRQDLLELTNDLQRASTRGLNFFAKVITQPYIGKYCLVGDVWYYMNNILGFARCPDPDGYKVITEEDGVYSGLSVRDGTYRNAYLLVPSLWEKMFAMQSLFVVSGRYADAKYSSLNVLDQEVSYWRVYKENLLDFLEGTIMQDIDSYAGVFDQAGKFHPAQIVTDGELEASIEKVAPTSDQKDPFDHPAPGSEYKRVDTGIPFNVQYYGLVYSLLVNNTYFDDEVDMIQYLKVCASKDECGSDYLERATGYNPPSADIKDGYKLFDFGKGKVRTTTYFSKGGAFEVHTFYHPEAPIVYSAPKRIGQERSLGVRLVDRLNEIVYGSKEPSLEGVQKLDYENDASIRGPYLEAKLKYEEAKPGEKLIGRDNKGKAYPQTAYEKAKIDLQYYVSLVDIIRDIMKRSQALY